MPSPEIVLYFTPDVKETGRIPLSDIRFEESKKTDRGKYQISLKHPCFLEGNCSSLKSAVKSTASLTFKWLCFGEKTKHVFKVNDYFEIWDNRGQGDVGFGRGGEWCYFRGVVKQTSSNEQGNVKTVSLNLENAGGWLLGDNSVYYLSQLIVTQGQVASNFFKPIKTKYGWLDAGGNETSKGEKLGLSKIKTPGELLETLVNGFGNERIKLLKKDFYDNHESIKSVEFFTGAEVAKNKVVVADRLSEMQGSILNILKQFEGRPFSEMFMVETTDATKVIWRNTRWRDYQEKLCMGIYAGSPENLIVLYSDSNVEHYGDKITGLGTEDPIYKKQYSGIVSETINRTNDDVVNAIYLFPAAWGHKTSVPTMVTEQTQYDPENAKRILDLDSVIRHGYRPIKIELPFIPDYMLSSEFDSTAKAQRKAAEEANTNLKAQYLSEFTGYAFSMYKNIQNSGNGADVYQNNLHVSVADDFMIVRSKSDEPGQDDPESFYVNVNKITWYFSASAPRTVLEWDRGFEKVRNNLIIDQGFLYA